MNMKPFDIKEIIKHRVNREAEISFESNTGELKEIKRTKVEKKTGWYNFIKSSVYQLKL